MRKHRWALGLMVVKVREETILFTENLQLHAKSFLNLAIDASIFFIFVDQKKKIRHHGKTRSLVGIARVLPGE